MSLVALRNKKPDEPKGGLVGMRTAPTKRTSNNMPSDEVQRPAPTTGDDTRYVLLQHEFDKMPWYKKLGTTADDLVRIGADGMSYGALDRILGPEAEKQTKDARLRAGWAGTAADIGGMVASPITRGVGMAGTAAREAIPLGKGVMKALTSLGITAGEGGALGATDALLSGDGNVKDSAATGGSIAAGVEAVAKHGIPIPLGMLATILSKVPYEDMSKIFEIASKSKIGSSAIKELQGNKAPVALLDAIDKTRGRLDGVPVSTDGVGKIEDALVDVFAKTTTSGGHKALDPHDQTVVNKLFTKAYDNNVSSSTFNRKNFDDLAGYLEDTKTPIAAEKSAGGRHVSDVHNVIKAVGSEESPMFKKLMELMDTKKAAYKVGKSTSTLTPNSGAFDTARDVGLATAFIAGSSALTNPALLAALLPMLASASPKIVGKVARNAGNIKRIAKGITPKGIGYGTSALAPDVIEDNRRRR